MPHWKNRSLERALPQPGVPLEAVARIAKARTSRSHVLNLAGLGLKEVPDAVAELHDNVRILDLSDNYLSELPWWLSDLSSLRSVDVRSNRMRTLPQGIGKLRKLTDLHVQNNLLDSIPSTLRFLPNLRRLELLGNPGIILPESLLATGNASEILRYHFETRDGMGGPLLELKLLAVGRGGAGKTTLLKVLAGDKPDPYEPETHSISIRYLTFRCPDGDVRARGWDFGGQEILHATHQFFLTERSLYLVVLEPRSNMAQRDAEYWLELIKTQGNESPTIVALNWSHGRQWHVDKVKLLRKFPFIVDFLPVDALHGDGIEALRSRAAEVIQREMGDVWVTFPYRWRDIKNAVTGMEDNFLTYERFTSLCATYGESEPAAQADLAGILHVLGLALHFGRDPRLNDTRVLNPTWVTGGVYSVIRSPSVKAKDGQVLVADMPEVLREAEEEKVIAQVDYPPETHGFFLELMRAFQLCYASEDEKGKPVRYLVPELLPDFEPEMPEQWDSAPVRLRYRYELLPPGLLPRFIVRTHALSEGAPHWRYGVVLRHADAAALIRAESDRHEINLFVLGGEDDTRRLLVGMVRRELESLHAELKMQPIEELELSGESDHWISVKSLRQVEGSTADQPQRLPIQPEGTAEVNVPAELNKLIPAKARSIERGRGSEVIPVRVFVSYAHDDERQLKRLDCMLGVLEQYHNIAPWHDKRLIAGEEWDTEIRRRLEEADIFLFIASATSLVRPYIRDPELRRAKERYESKALKVVTVKLEPCACDEDPFLGKLQRLAPKFRSIAEANLRSVAWEQVRRDLVPLISYARIEKTRAAALA